MADCYRHRFEADSQICTIDTSLSSKLVGNPERIPGGNCKAEISVALGTKKGNIIRRYRGGQARG